MRVLLTGAAGFIGSHTAGALLGRGDSVLAIDSFSGYYDRPTKESNVEALLGHPAFELRELDLADEDVAPLFDGVDAVVHLSAHPGVRSSWQEFDSYVVANIQVTQRLLEAAKQANLRRFVYSSSSSVYGLTRGTDSREDDRPSPVSPYGVTKLAAEQLCCVYAANWNVPTTSLRYFTVFGSRQRPDMLIHRVIAGALEKKPLPLYGTGDQVRDFTHVTDIVTANLAALDSDTEPGTVCNVGGGTSVSVHDAIGQVEELTGEQVSLDKRGDAAGDVRTLRGDIRRAKELLGWAPSVSFSDGLREQIDWHASRLPDRLRAS